MAQKPIFYDIDLAIRKHPITGDILLKTDDEAIKQAVRVLVLTKFYERPMHPEKGSQVFSALFENDSPEVRAFIRDSIEEVLRKYESRIRVIDVQVNISEEHTYKVAIYYIITATGLQSQVSFFLSRIR